MLFIAELSYCSKVVDWKDKTCKFTHCLTIMISEPNIEKAIANISDLKIYSILSIKQATLEDIERRYYLSGEFLVLKESNPAIWENK